MSQPEDRRRRVCQVFSGAEGAEWVVEQLRELRDRYGYDVSAVVAGRQGSLVDRLQKEQIPVHAFQFVFSLRQVRERIPEIFALARFFREQGFDVVHSHGFWTFALCRPAAWLADVPVRIAMYPGPFHLEGATARWIDRVSAWMETTVVPACRQSFDLCREIGIPESRLAIIYYGADVRKFTPAQTPPAGIRAQYGWPEDTPVVALVAWFYGRLRESIWVPAELHHRGFKGQEDFVRAAQLILSSFPSAKFLLVGGPFGPAGEAYLDQVKWLVQQMNLQDKVVFTGHRNDVPRILRDVTVAVQASLTENLGGTIEALLMECPLVVTRIGGMIDSVIDGETGIHVTPSDPADLARGILEVLRNPEKARKLACNGRRFMLTRFSLERTVDDLHALYSRLLSQAPARNKWQRFAVRAWRTILAWPIAIYIGCRLRFESFLRRSFHSGPKTPLCLDARALRELNLAGDIAPANDLVQLHLGNGLPENGLFLGRGWYSLEGDAGGRFRWMHGEGEIVVTCPSGTEGRLILDAGVGPGRQWQPFLLQIRDSTGAVIDSATVVSLRQEVTFNIGPIQADGAIYRLTAPKGRSIPYDARILNLRLYRFAWDQPLFRNMEMLIRRNLLDDIAPAECLAELHQHNRIPENGIFLGSGWHSLERDAGGPFRWMGGDAEIVITQPDGDTMHMLLDVQPGPGLPPEPFELEIRNRDGVTLDRATVLSRQEVIFHVRPENAEGCVLLLTTPAGSPIPSDDRILCLGVHRIAWIE